MTLRILAIASTVAVVSAYASGAQACISCSYVPPVVNSGSGGGSYEAQPSRRERSHSERSEKSERRERASKKVTKHEAEPKKEKEAAKHEAAPKKDEDTAAAASPAATDKVTAEIEHSSITTTGSSIANQVKAAVAAPGQPQNENSTFTTAAPAADKAAQPKRAEQVTADKNLGCKKFFPSTGLTLTVPCE